MYPLNDRIAHNFKANAVDASGNVIELDFHETLARRGKCAVLFFYPLNHTFVCPTELFALNQKMQTFSEINTDVYTVSIDSVFSHMQWRNQSVNQGGIGPVDFTMISDISHNITRSYGVEHPEENIAYRATFIIDQDKKIWSQTINNLPIGRNIDEIIRTVKAVQHVREHGENMVCPADWKDADPGMQATNQGTSEYLSKLEETSS